uniref:GT23 domain-containing protein n=1 Tax=Trichobilharzia regenti TaxID=157069 RepID=A0AA85JDX7_TRIRE|nr:unnamed protein product [Trichobilharzia regenti]
MRLIWLHRCTKVKLILIAVTWIPLLPLLHFCVQDFFSKITKSKETTCREAVIQERRDAGAKIDWISAQMILLHDMFNNYSQNHTNTLHTRLFPVTSSIGYSHEILRRRAIHYLHEMKYTSVGLHKIAQSLEEFSNLHESNTSVSSIRISLERYEIQLHEIIEDMEAHLKELGETDGFSRFRITGLNQLAETVQRRIRQLQNPTNCQTAKYITFDFTNLCGFGCSVHQLTACLHMAFEHKRVLVLKKHSPGDIFREWLKQNTIPLSEKCSYEDLNDKTDIIECPLKAYIPSDNDWVPNVLPRDLAEKLLICMKHRMHGLLLINQSLSGFRRSDHPVVGVHIRRTDKLIWEAQSHDLEEYMKHVDDYFNSFENTTPLLKPEIYNSNGYNLNIGRFIHRNRIHHKSSKLYSIWQSKKVDVSWCRKSQKHDSMSNAFIDTLALSETDFLVCTFSSNICRLAYELMQTRHEKLGDASQLVKSLDNVHHSVDFSKVKFEVLIPDLRAGLNYGDLVNLYTNHWNGSSSNILMWRNDGRSVDGQQKLTSVKQTNSFNAPAYKFRPELKITNFSWL